MENTYPIRIMKTASEIQQCQEIVFLLRPHLNEDKWISMISEMIRNEKYNLAVMMDDDKIIAFAGYRVMTSLHTGNIIYIDDLYTLESYRGKGLASQLLKHVEDIAISTNKDAVVLDTDFNNNTAQKVYLKRGFRLAALHLSSTLRK